MATELKTDIISPSTTNHILGDSSGNLTFEGTANAAGGQLTTTGKAFVMGF